MATLAQLQGATSYEDLATIFGIPAALWAGALYGRTDNYHRFEIPKRSGGTRQIESPFGTRREIQAKLAVVLAAAYSPSPHAHGFIAGRSIVSNAAPHVGKQTIVNVDLLDFFKTITFKRARGILLAPPFRLDWRVANILAQACCCDGHLPAGGITSPALSNFAAARLDRRLATLGLRHGGVYTRYADDMTLSFDRPLRQIPGIAGYDTVGKPTVGPQVLEILVSEGFQPNAGKFRVSEKSSRKLVTGIVVNQRPNVRRDWLRALESVIYAIHKFGPLVVAQSSFPSLAPDIGARVLLRKVHGRLAYLFMVRGAGDWLTADLAHRFNSACPDPLLRVPDTEMVNRTQRTSRPLLIVTATYGAGGPTDEWDEQGTAFVRADGVIVTAAHVITNDYGHLYPAVSVRRYRAPNALFRCDVLHADNHRDLAFLRLRVHDADLLRHRYRLGETPREGDRVTSYGFPAYLIGHAPSRQEHEVTNVRPVSGVTKCIITGQLAGGLSGGPVLDADFNVVGVVHRGTVGGGHANEFVAVDEIHAAFPMR